MTNGNQLEKRGVYEAKHRVDGMPVLYAVKSDGNRLGKPLIVPISVSVARVYDWLREKLDRVDPPKPPRPALRLVTGAPEPTDPYANPYRPPRETRRSFPHRPPAPPDDAVAHALRVAKQASRRIPYFR